MLCRCSPPLMVATDWAMLITPIFCPCACFFPLGFCVPWSGHAPPLACLFVGIAGLFRRVLLGVCSIEALCRLWDRIESGVRQTT